MTEFFPTNERHKRILSILAGQQKISIGEIVDQLSISEATARRDLRSLAAEGKLQRVHGGAVAMVNAHAKTPILDRMNDQAKEKHQIGLATANLIKDKESIFLGAGTTVFEVAKNLRERNDLTIVTNSLPVLNILTGIERINVISLGGMLHDAELSFIGHVAEQALTEIRVDKVVIGAKGISLEHGLTNDYLQATLTDRAILKMGREVIVAADHTKVNHVSTAVIDALNVVHTFVTDTLADKKFIHALRAKGINIIIA